MATEILIGRDLYNNWNNKTDNLLDGELIYVTDKNALGIGDGSLFDDDILIFGGSRYENITRLECTDPNTDYTFNLQANKTYILDVQDANSVKLILPSNPNMGDKVYVFQTESNGYTINGNGNRVDNRTGDFYISAYHVKYVFLNYGWRSLSIY